MKGANNTYFGSVKEAIKTTVEGAKLTMRHLKDAFVKERRDATTANDENYFKKQEGIVTLQYPREALPVPDNGRYKLHNEMEDCIVCDKCAKICPVNCIDIEPIKSNEVFGSTSDGTPKRLYAAKFDIDMAKCCFCGLCTTVCPTECLTMTKDYDFSEFNVANMNFGFANLTAAEAEEKRKAYDAAQAAKQSKKLQEEPDEENISAVKKPSVKRVLKPKLASSEEEPKPSTLKPVFKPKMKAKSVMKKINKEDGEKQDEHKTRDTNQFVTKNPEKDEQEAPKPKVIKPKISAKVRPVIKRTSTEEGNNEVAKDGKPPKYRPKMKVKVKPVMKKKDASDENEKQAE
ncbi:MAG: 4Fe-4S dicluster domain-containing protein [Bacteroidota bacterium]